MKKMSKRSVLQVLAEHGNCCEIPCSQCPYDVDTENSVDLCSFRLGVMRVGAKLMLENYKESFDKNKIRTVLDRDKVPLVGARGYIGDSIADVRRAFNNSHVFELHNVSNDEESVYPFTVISHDGAEACYALFYPLDEDE